MRIRIRDLVNPRSGILDPGSWIRDKHPGSATLTVRSFLKIQPNSVLKLANRETRYGAILITVHFQFGCFIHISSMLILDKVKIRGIQGYNQHYEPMSRTRGSFAIFFNCSGHTATLCCLDKILKLGYPVFDGITYLQKHGTGHGSSGSRYLPF
jgi:hypothetical protein